MPLFATFLIQGTSNQSANGLPDSGFFTGSAASFITYECLLCLDIAMT